MESSNIIYKKLEAFTRKYYNNELLRGAIFFVGIGLLYLLFTLFIEYFLWLKPLGRTVLFYAFIGVEIFLLVRFILFPLSKLFKLQRGISYKEASEIIGNHFPEVSDKLTNYLQLANSHDKSELLAASIEQKGNSLQPIPFVNAISYQKNKKFIPLALLPIFFFVFFYMSGNTGLLSQSFNRVVNYNEQFSPPAPFEFVILNNKLQAEQNADFLLQVKTKGSVVPENATIVIGNESYFMESVAPGKFEYRIPKITKSVAFHIEANKVTSKLYELEIVSVPSIANFEMVLSFPAYLRKSAESVKGSGNAIVPEGTRITWKMTTIATKKVEWTDQNATFSFYKVDNDFSFEKNISQNTEYQVHTSNDNVRDYEKLNYRISVIKDQHPTISAAFAPDSLKIESNYVLGQVADDYGLSKLQIVYYAKGSKSVTRASLAVKNDVYDKFIFSFPGTLPVEQGVSYDYYFEVFDNDAPHGYKSARSAVFSERVSTEQEKEDLMLQQQNQNINSLSKSLKNQDRQMSELEKLQKSGKEKETLEYKDQQKVNDFIERQKQQSEMMKEFAKKMDQNLEKLNEEKKDPFKEELQKRLDKVDKDLEKNQKLLDELKKLNDKISKEELFEKLEKFKQTSKNQTKSLEQLVELTKKYYVEKKAEQIAEKLQQLADKQDKLADDKQNSTEKQQQINDEFDKIQEELQKLDQDNKELKAPLDIPKDVEKEKSIDEDQKSATDNLKKEEQQKAKPKQKSAAKKMKELGEQMSQSMAAGAKEQMEEDVKVLRQILDNLLAFSFSQEDLMDKFKNLKRGSPAFNKNLKAQQDLKLQFKHVDDSLFALSLRQPMIADGVTTEIGNVHYNIDRSLESLVEAQVPRGISHQQYTITAANKLADLLSDGLNNMQMSMQGMGEGKPKPGKGEGSGGQLPDIIKKQEGLGEKMKNGMKDGKKPGDGEKPGQGNKPGQSGKDGQGTKSGQQGESGQDGEGDAKAILDIYREQMQLRESLEKELNKQGIGGAGQSAVEQMKQIEKQLLNKGFNNETLQRILNLKYELLKLDKAIQQQGEENKRQAETNKKDFSNGTNALPKALQEYVNSIEILNRQTLPLRSKYNRKVQEYFKEND